MKVIQKRLMGTIVLACILTISGCSSSSNSQVESDSDGANNESTINEEINTTPSSYQILKVLEPLLSSIVKFTDTEYVAEGRDPNYKGIFPIMKSNFAAIKDFDLKITTPKRMPAQKNTYVRLPLIQLPESTFTTPLGKRRRTVTRNGGTPFLR